MLRSSAIRGPHGRKLAKLGLGLAAVLAALEIAARTSGVIDFPLYVVDDDVGYLPRPNQHGAFLNRNTWAFNERGMPTARAWSPDAMPNLLLIGNSIVAGGNPYDQREKLGSLLERSLADRFAVWPIAVGGWSTVNQIAYLERHPDVVSAADFFVWSQTSGGLRAPAAWLGDDTFPRRHPTWATAYVLKRALTRRFGMRMRQAMGEPYAPPGPAGPSAQQALAANLARFERMVERLAAASRQRHPGALLLYPNVQELAAGRRGLEWLPEHAAVERVAAAHGLLVVDLTRHPEWTADLYRDEIHPTTAGNAVLARILNRTIERAADE